MAGPILTVLEQADAVILRIEEKQIHMYFIPEFKDAVNSAISSQPPKVIFDLSIVEYLDSSAMGALFQMQKQISEYAGTMYLTNINHTIQMVFKLTKSDLHFKICQDNEEALASP